MKKPSQTAPFRVRIELIYLKFTRIQSRKLGGLGVVHVKYVQRVPRKGGVVLNVI